MKSKGSFFEHNLLIMRLNLITGLYVPSLKTVASSARGAAALAAFRLFGDAIVIVGLVSFLVKAATKETSLTDRCVVIAIIFSSVQVTLKMTYMAWHRQSFYDYLDLWDQSFQNLDPPGELSKHRQPEIRLVKILTFVFLTLALPALPMNLMPLLPASQKANGGRYLSIPAWFPFDPLVSPAYELAVSFQTLSGWISVTRLVAFDATFFSLAAMQVSQMKHLEQCLERLFLEPREEAVVGLASVDEVDLGAQPFKTTKRKTISDQKEYDNRLKEWIKYHQCLMETGSKLQALYSPILLVEFATMTLVFCFSAFVFVGVPLDPARRQLFVMFAVSHLTQLFAFCHYGDRLENASLSLREAAFCCGWHEKEVLPETRSSLKLLIHRVQTPLKLSAFGLIALNAETFLNILRTAISYLMVLIEVLA